MSPAQTAAQQKPIRAPLILSLSSEFSGPGKKVHLNDC